MNGEVVHNRSESLKEITAAIVKAQQAMKPAVKDSINPFFSSAQRTAKYADLASVWEALLPFRDNGIAIIQRPQPYMDGLVGLETIMLHSSGEWISCLISTPAQKQDPQGIGSAITYLRRYSLGCMTGLVTEEDDDGNAASHAPQQRPPYQQNKAEAQRKINELRKPEPPAGLGTDGPPPSVPASGEAPVQTDDPATPYRHKLRAATTNQEINAVWRSIPDALKQELYTQYTQALNALKGGNK